MVVERRGGEVIVSFPVIRVSGIIGVELNYASEKLKFKGSPEVIVFYGRGCELCKIRRSKDSRLGLSDMASSNRGIQIGSAWFQRKVNLRPQHRGVHLVTEEILKQMPEISQFSVGLFHVQILHTSASLALNESWDPDVRDDMEMMLNKIVPEGLPYRHSCEGPDDMPAHVKACFLGSSLTIPITDGKLNLGTWQGIWLCEHRDHAGSRKVVVTINGCLRDCSRSPLSPVSPIASTSS